MSCLPRSMINTVNTQGRESGGSWFETCSGVWYPRRRLCGAAIDTLVDLIKLAGETPSFHQALTQGSLSCSPGLLPRAATQSCSLSLNQGSLSCSPGLSLSLNQGSLSCSPGLSLSLNQGSLSCSPGLSLSLNQGSLSCYPGLSLSLNQGSLSCYPELSLSIRTRTTAPVASCADRRDEPPASGHRSRRQQISLGLFESLGLFDEFRLILGLYSLESLNSRLGIAHAGRHTSGHDTLSNSVTGR